VWSGIGLRSSSYVSLSEYTTQLTNAKVLDEISTKSLIDAAEMHSILKGLMSFNSTFETWNDYG